MEVQPKLRRHFGHLDLLRLKKPQSRFPRPSLVKGTSFTHVWKGRSGYGTFGNAAAGPRRAKRVSLILTSAKYCGRHLSTVPNSEVCNICPE